MICACKRGCASNFYLFKYGFSEKLHEQGFGSVSSNPVGMCRKRLKGTQAYDKKYVIQ
jgi:hypothetical protein